MKVEQTRMKKRRLSWLF